MQNVFRKLQYCDVLKKRRRMQNRGNHKSVISGRKYFKVRIHIQQQVEAYCETLYVQDLRYEYTLR